MHNSISTKSYEDREKELIKIFLKDNKNFSTLKQMGDFYFKHKKMDKAEKLYRNILKKDNNDHEIYYKLALILIANKKIKEAAFNFQKSVEIKPDFIPANIDLCQAYLVLNDYNSLLIKAEESIKLFPNNSYLKQLFCLALIKNKIRFDECIDILNNLILLKPKNYFYYYLLSFAHRYNGELDECDKLISFIFKNDYKNFVNKEKLFLSFISNKKNILLNEHIEYFKNLLNDKFCKKNFVYEAFFKYYHQKKQYMEAMPYLIEMNKHLDQASNCDMNNIKKTFISLKEKFSNHLNTDFNFKVLPVIPVFICGMPRSGTSLIEQILDSHSNVTGLGEISYLEKLLGFRLINPNTIKFKEFLDNLENIDFLKKIREDYVNLIMNDLSKLEGGNKSKYICDKYLYNFIIIGFLQLIFPECKIIYCNRNPIDNCFSLYYNKFTNSNFDYSHNQKKLGEFYLLHKDLMEFWIKNYNDKIFTLKNEDLINNQKKITKELLNYCDLDWEDNCMKYYDNNRHVHTTSERQVKRPINNDSIGVWKNYESHLSELIKIIN